jgi:hypothetical protein
MRNFHWPTRQRKARTILYFCLVARRNTFHKHTHTHALPPMIHALKMPQNGGLQSICNGRLNCRRRKEEPYKNWYDEKPNQRTKKVKTLLISQVQLNVCI